MYAVENAREIVIDIDKRYMYVITLHGTRIGSLIDKWWYVQVSYKYPKIYIQNVRQHVIENIYVSGRIEWAHTYSE